MAEINRGVPENQSINLKPQ